jgi:Protein of unknown function (DUF2934)
MTEKHQIPPAHNLEEAATTGDTLEGYAAMNNREKIAKLAYKYYEARGYKHGSHEDDWHRAERELNGRGQREKS